MMRSFSRRAIADLDRWRVGTSTGAAHRTLRGQPRRIGLPVSSATGSTAPWEAATALAEVVAVEPDVLVEVVPVDGAARMLLVDHPLTAHARVRVLPTVRTDELRRAAWLRTLSVLLLPYRHAVPVGWLRACAAASTSVVSVADPSTAVFGLAAAYPVGPVGLVDADDVAAAVLRGLAAARTSPDRGRRRRDLPAVCAGHGAVYRLALGERPAALSETTDRRNDPHEHSAPHDLASDRPLDTS